MYAQQPVKKAPAAAPVAKAPAVKAPAATTPVAKAPATKAPVAKAPLYWYSHYLSRFFDIELGSYQDGRRRVLSLDPPIGRDYFTTWLTDRYEDSGEIINLAGRHPEKVLSMRKALKQKLLESEVPPELLERFKLTQI